LSAYRQFLESKIHFDHACGFDIDPGEISKVLIRHQPDIVQWMVKGGRRACFAQFGLGKTMMDLETMRLVLARSGGSGLIVCPLGVRQEFLSDGPFKLGWEEAPRFIRRDSEIDGDGIYVTNYEAVREGNVTPTRFKVASLDEASVLRSYGSKTYQEFMPLFADVPYRFVYTATPSPNRYKELIHYAGFLGIMDTGQALTRFFQRDSTKANNLTLYPHKVKEFWLWVSSWAVFIQKPSDLGYSDEGYELPKLDVRYHEVPASYETPAADRDGQTILFKDSAMGLQDAAREKRDSLPARVAKAAELLRQKPEAHCILWHDLEDERRAIKAAVPTVAEVYGSLDLEAREQRVQDFGNGKLQYLSTKPSLSGSGCNFQRHCHWAIFTGIGYDFNDFIQAIHRIQRFQQPHPVRIDIVYSEAEREVLKVLQQKWTQHEEMVARMAEIIREFGLNPIKAQQAMARSIGIERQEARGENYLVANNDCVEECTLIEDNTQDLIVTSIPFANHYEYTPSYNDFGHTESNDQFWRQMDFLTPELLRILKPGRIAAIHTKDRILFGNVTGAGVPTVSPFHCEAVMHYRKHGFDYMGMITVVTDVVRENNQTYRLGWSEQCKDGTKMGAGSPEYIIILHKPQTDRGRGYADVPVTKDKADYTRARWQVDAHAFWRSSGNRLLTAEELAKLGPDKLAKLFTEQSLQQVYDYEQHVQIGEELDRRGALPSTFMSLAPGSHHPDVWHDINRMLTLNGEQDRRCLEKHVCPLQFDIVDRLITRYSNKGEQVFDPFGGLFTVPLRALKLGRRGRAAELNPVSFRDGVRHLKAAEVERSMPDLFGSLEEAA
jgi:DNA modification methylase